MQKKPFTQNAANILAGKLGKVSSQEAVARLQTAVVSGWLTAFYPGDEDKYEYLRNGTNRHHGKPTAPKKLADKVHEGIKW